MPGTSEALLAGLDPEQREVALAARGPVCVLAGAGTGKTRAITYRIAYAALSGTVDPAHVLALTFTVRAAGELRGRLRQLGAGGMGTQQVPGQLTMYTTPWCGYCRNLKRQLARDGIEMVEVDIERDEAAAEFVMSVNGGNQTVPTVLFPDGTALTNPSAAQVKAQLTALAG